MDNKKIIEKILELKLIKPQTQRLKNKSKNYNKN